MVDPTKEILNIMYLKYVLTTFVIIFILTMDHTDESRDLLDSIIDFVGDYHGK